MSAGACAHGVPGGCGCCEGIAVRTPVEVINRAGLPAIAARIGTHAQFRESMMARLSSQPGLAGLRTRAPDDFSTALLDAWATVADVLTFYQERIANESYLRTATEPLSVRELAAEIGYERDRGTAAGTALAFTVDAIGDPPQPITIERGTRVVSVPRPGDTPQTFETVQEIEARAEWNALHPQLTEPQVLVAGAMHAYLEHIVTDLKAGDALLFVSGEREGNPDGAPFDLRRIVRVTPERDADRTKLEWEGELTAACCDDGPSIYALRQRAAIFGHNAPDWRPMPVSMMANYLGLADPENVTEGEKLGWPQHQIFAPRIPVEPEDPVVIPTAKAVAKAAITAAQKAAEQARDDAFNKAIETVNAFKSAVEAVVNDIGQITDLENAVTTLNTTWATVNGVLTKLNTVLEGMVGTAAAEMQKLRQQLEDKRAEAERLGNKIGSAVGHLQGGRPVDALNALL